MLSLSLTLQALSQNIGFDQTTLDFNGFSAIVQGTSLKFGPDERLYVAQLNGDIKAYTIIQSGVAEYKVEGVEVLGMVKALPNHDDTGKLAFDNRGNRQITGITVAGSSSNPVVYVSSSDPKWGGPSGDKVLDTNSGIITRLTWTGSNWEVVDLVRGLPRSEENHSTNGLEYTEINGKPYLLVASGGLTNAGSPSKNFAYITEYALSAAILSVDLDMIENLPILEDQNSGRKYKYDIPTLDDPTRPNKNGIYNPNDPGYDGIDVGDPFGGNDGLNMGMVVEGGPVQIFSSGYRNAYDLVVTQSGRVYATDNGANINWGGLPENEGNPNLVTNNYLPSEPGGSPLNPSPSGEHVDNQDHLLLITDDLSSYEFGSFYAGHPTPIRANPGQPYTSGSAFPFQPEGAGLYTKFIGDDNDWANINPLFPPNDKFRTEILEPIAPGQPGFEEYAANSLPANWPPVPLTLSNPAEADFIAPTLANPNGPQPNIVTIFPNNSNGIDEYKASNFDEALKGALIVGKNGGDVHVVYLKEDGSLEKLEINKFNMNGGNALGIACNGDDEIFPGTIWVATFDSRITVLTPADDIFCVDPDHPNFDPLADYDRDGYTNQDEIDNGTDYCNGASIPNDYDKDFVSDLNDLDDDGDGILDEDDPFQIGDPRNLPIENQLFSDQIDNRDRQSGYLGLGLTGLMNNGAPNPNWLNWLDKPEERPGPNDIYGGTAGAIQVSMTGGTANGTQNNQEKGFQFGVNVGTQTGKFLIRSGLIGLSSPGQLFDFDGDGEVGIQMGDGTQSNFLKLVFTKSHLVFNQEINDVPGATPIMHEIKESERPGTNTLIELQFEVTPSSGEIEAFYKFDNDPRVSIGVIVAEGMVEQAIKEVETPLAIGIYGTSNDFNKDFIGVWNYFKVSGQQPFIVRQIGDISRMIGDLDLELDLMEFFGDENGSENLIYTVEGNTDQNLLAQISGSILTLGFSDRETDSEVTIRATDSDGFFIEQSFNVNVDISDEILLRINAGGPVIQDSTDNPNWLANNVPGSVSQAEFSVNSGVVVPNSFNPANRHSSIPAYITDDTYTKIFAHERYSTQSEFKYAIPLPDGDYTVNIYMGNGWSGTSLPNQRIFNIKIEGEERSSLVDLSGTYGHQVGAMESFPVTLTDGELNIDFVKVVEHPLVNAIEIIGQPIQTPIEFTALDNLTGFAGDDLSGELIVEASGGDGNLNYTAEGMPPGVFIDSSNGSIYGKIADNAIANSPYTVEVIIDDSDNFSSDAVSFTFVWTILPAWEEMDWTVKGENQNYTGRHENSFVQAGEKFYLLGGRENTRTVEIYDYKNDTWRSLPNSSPLDFNHFQAVTYEGLIWIIGAFKTNNFPAEEPAEHVWAFDPAKEVWIQGPEIPEERRRGSAGLVVFEDKFYLVNGNKKGHDGEFVSYFDEYNPKTGEWTVLENSPRARDHFFATVIGNEMYVVSGRRSGGPGGVFAPLVPEVDVYSFSNKSWRSLSADKNLPTPRAAAITNNLWDRLIVAGGEVETSSQALKVTEMFDPKSQSWTRLKDLNFGRHGTQGIVSGKGLYVLAGSPNLGGGNQKNMEVFGIDEPKGTPIEASELIAPDEILLETGFPKTLELSVENGNTGAFIQSMNIEGDDGDSFVFSQALLTNSLLKVGEKTSFQIEYVGNKSDAQADLVIKYQGNLEKVIKLIGDGTFESVRVFYNAGSGTTANFEGENYVGDVGSGLFSASGAFTNPNASNELLFQSERYGNNFSFNIPVPNGTYRVRTYHNEVWFGKPGGGQGGGGIRVFDIKVEGETVKSNVDLFYESGNNPVVFTYENVLVADGVLNIQLISSKDNATISGISIVNEFDTPILPPSASLSASTSGGEVPLTVQFDGSSSSASAGIDSYFWDFGDGNTATDVSPSHTYTVVGNYTAVLTVTDLEGNTDSNSLQISVNPQPSDPGPIPGDPEFTLLLNAGTTANVNYQQEQYLGDGNFPDYFNTTTVGATGSSAFPVLFRTERFGTNLTYTIPVPNGLYTVSTYHNELWFGLNGPSAQPGRRVFDINIQGENKLQNFDLFVENNNQPLVLDFEQVMVTNGTLTLNLVAKENNASISAIAIRSEAILPPKLEVTANASVTSGNMPLEVSFTSVVENEEGELSYLWDFGDGTSSSQKDPVHTFTQEGEFLVKVDIEDGTGAVAADEILITVIDPSSIPEFLLRLNSGTSANVQFGGEDYLGDSGFPEYFNTTTVGATGLTAFPVLFRTERFGTNLTYSIPVPNGTYKVSTYHNELWFGLNGPTAQPGRRVFDINIQGQNKFQNLDLFVENDNQPLILDFSAIQVTNGVLTLNLVAKANNATISGLRIESIGTVEAKPLVTLSASPTSGLAPLNVAFSSQGTTGEGPLNYQWNFGDGSTSTAANPSHVFQDPGNYNVSLTVADINGAQSSKTLQIQVFDQVPAFSLHLNTGSSNNILFNNITFNGDVNFSQYFSTSGITNYNTGNVSPLFHSERFNANLKYSIPVPNGKYVVKTYHNELYFGKFGPAAEAGQRVFSILIEGVMVKENFDMFVEAGNQPTELIFEEVEVQDEVLNIDLVASSNNASISGLSINELKGSSLNGGESMRLFYSENVKFKVDEVYSKGEATFRLVPNPAEHQSKLLVETSQEVKMITLHDMRGSLVHQIHVNDAMQKAFEIPVDHLKQGVYLVGVLGEKGYIKQLRLIVKK